MNFLPLPKRDLLTLSTVLALGAFLLELFLASPILHPAAVLTSFIGAAMCALRSFSGVELTLSTFSQVLLALGASVPVLLTASLETTIETATSLLFVLTGTRFCGRLTQRELLQVYLLCFLVLLGISPLKGDLSFGLLLLAVAALEVIGLIFLNASREVTKASGTQVRLLAISGLGVFCGIVPLAVAFFLILPRTQLPVIPFFGTTQSPAWESTLSAKDIAEIKNFKGVAFRLKWLKGTVPKVAYLRMFVYRTYENGTWYEDLSEKAPHRFVRSDALVEVSVAGVANALPSPGYATSVSTVKGPKGFVGKEGTVRLSEEAFFPALYRIEAYTQGPIPEEIPAEEFLQVPRNLRRTLKEFSKRFEERDPMRLASSVSRFLSQGYRYELNAEDSGRDPVEDFLFLRKTGNCKDFATAMVLVLRTLGVPARVVAGYLTAAWNPLGKYFLVRHSDAHAWVEVFVKGVGWIPFDPTPPQETSPAFYEKLLLLWDYLQMKWLYWVVEYDIYKQVRIFSTLTKPNELFPKGALKAVGLVVLTLTLGYTGILLIKNKVKKRRPVEEFLEFFEKLGYEKRAGETLQEFVERLSKDLPQLKGLLRRFLELYYEEAFAEVDTEQAQLSVLKEVQKAYKAPPTSRKGPASSKEPSTSSMSNSSF